MSVASGGKIRPAAMPYLKGMLERDKSTKLRQSDALLARQATLKLSRDATREVRRCLRMRESAKAESRVRTLRLAHRPIDSIYLSPDDAGTRIIPSRLPGHALIHGLVRSQKPTRAAKQIRSLIEDGTNVKHATFSAVMRGLLNQARKITKAPQTDNDSWSAPNETVLELDPDKIHNKYCRHALILLMIARKHGVKREMWMYIRLINTLVTHKSYLEATLVVESLLKDWRVWNALHSFFASVPPQSSDPNTYWIISGDRLATHSQVVQSELYQLYQQLSVSYLEPTPALLAKCIIPLNDAFRTNPTPPSKATIMSILQPFMVLLSLLERRLYPFSSVGRIIRAVSDLPAHWNLREHIVWTTKRLKGGKSEERQPRKVPNIQIEADKILEGLMTSLPSRPREPPHPLPSIRVRPEPEEPIAPASSPQCLNIHEKRNSSPRSDSSSDVLPPAPIVLSHLPPMLPPLEATQYIELLQYALHTRRNAFLARDVYRHMTRIRDPPLVPGQDVLYAMKRAISGKVPALRRFATGVGPNMAWHTNATEIENILKEVIGDKELERIQALPANTPTAVSSLPATP